MNIVQILGHAPNLRDTSEDFTERWCTGAANSYRRKLKPALSTWTRWFNFHTLRHIATYPGTFGYVWYQRQDGSRPIYLQEADYTIPGSVAFPRDAIQQYFAIDGKPCRYFTFSGAWLIAFAIYLHETAKPIDKIELWGFELAKDKQYDFERPCFFYWINMARKHGIEVFLPPEVEISESGDPATYTGPLYGWEPHSAKYARTF